MEKVFSSSVNPEKVSMTVTGALLSVAPIIIAIFQLLGIGISETFVFEIVQQIGVVTSSGLMLFGMLRKVYFAVKSN